MKTLKILIKKLKKSKPILFDGDNIMFMNNCYDIRKYAEYGVGLSTEWVFNHSKAEILSIETDEEWIKRVKKKITVRQQSFYNSR